MTTGSRSRASRRSPRPALPSSRRRPRRARRGARAAFRRGRRRRSSAPRPRTGRAAARRRRAESRRGVPSGRHRRSGRRGAPVRPHAAPAKPEIETRTPGATQAGSVEDSFTGCVPDTFCACLARGLSAHPGAHEEHGEQDAEEHEDQPGGGEDARHGDRVRPRRRCSSPERRENPAMRLNAWLARAGVASRRKADELIKAGRVTVNGEVGQLNTFVQRTDEVSLDGRPLAKQQLAYVLLHKPAGVVTTASDPQGGRTVVDLVEHPVARRSGRAPRCRHDGCAAPDERRRARASPRASEVRGGQGLRGRDVDAAERRRPRAAAHAASSSTTARPARPTCAGSPAPASS